MKLPIEMRYDSLVYDRIAEIKFGLRSEFISNFGLRS